MNASHDLTARRARSRRARSAAAIIVLAAGAAFASPAERTRQEIRPIDAKERAALDLALAYASGGGGALVDRLADGAALAELSRAAAVAEIEARLGPSEGAVWHLETAPAAATEVFFHISFPSGIEEWAALGVVAAPEPRLLSLRITADPVPKAGAEAAGGIFREMRPDGRRGPGAGSALFLILFAAIAFLARRTPSLRLGAVALLAFACTGKSPFAGGAAEGSKSLELGSLGGLRRELALGSSVTSSAGASVGDEDSRVARVRELWRAGSALAEGDPAAASSILAGRGTEPDPPLADLLTTRLSMVAFDARAAVRAYERLRDAGFETDGLLLEQYEAESFAAESGEASLAPLIAIGTRLAEPWYEAARTAAYDGDWDGGERLLRLAWSERPMTREELLGDAALASLAARPTLFPLIEPGSPLEPMLDAPGGRRGAPLAANGRSFRCGNFLRVEAGSEPPFRLEIPGGAGIAPPTSLLLDAVELRKRDEAEAERRSRELLAAGRTPELTPRLLRVAETLLPALLRERRFEDVESFSRPLLPALARLAPKIPMARAAALLRLDREAEAKQLLLDYAKAQIEGHRPAPATLYSLAELLAGEGDYETAIRLVHKADRQVRQPFGEGRIRIYEMARDLASDSNVLSTEHFDVRYPRSTGTVYPRDLGGVLESERRRLARYAPARDPKRIEVELFPLQSFLDAFGGDVTVIGIYDGRLRVPLADLRTLRPEVVAIVSHELMHALIARSTRDAAPHWFQEGLAQRIETGTLHVNPYPDLEKSGRTIAFPLIESILRGFAEANLVALAYAEAQWSVAFVEQRFGERGLRTLVDAFAEGMGTEEAIATLSGWTVADFDRELRAWASTKAPAQHRVAAIRFDQMEGTLFSRGEKKERREIDPLVGGGPAVRPAAGAAAPKVDLGPEMRRWYEGYRVASAPVRRAYAPILQRLQAGKQMPPPAECVALQGAVAPFRGRSAELDAPDPHAATALRTLFHSLDELAGACAAGRFDQTLRAFDRVGRATSDSAARLKPYGLTP